MKVKMVFFARAVVFIVSLCVFYSLCPLVSPAAEAPRAQLDEAERHFTQAYGRLLARDNWGALDYLDRALRANTYLVDYYLMKGLVMNRIGDYAAGREALESYLEVRPMDLQAPRILSYAIAQQRSLQRIVSPTAVSARWRISQTDLQNELSLGLIRPFNAKGMGKAAMWGDNLYLADTFGDCVFYRNGASRAVNVLPVTRPAAVLPTGDGSFYIVTFGGEVHYFGAFEAQTMLPSRAGVLENTSVSDAAFISESEFAAADPVRREIAFYSLAAMDASGPTAKTGAWSPPDPPGSGAAFFEPRAVAPYGQWLAAADRSSDKIFFLNLRDRREFFSADVSRPRDIEWSPWGELFVINDGGELLRLSVDFMGGRIEAADTLETGMTDGWTLFTSRSGDIYCIDIAGGRLWKSVPLPDDSLSMAAVTVSAPTISREENRESFLLDAVFMSPFKTYVRTAALMANVVWNNRTVASAAEWNESARPAGVFLVNRPAPPGAVNAAINNVLVEDGADVRISLPSIWNSRGGALTNFIIDSTVDMTPEDLNVITLFCLNNGVELDVWARSVPPLELVRASGLTGGKTLFSVMNPPELSPPHARLRIRVPLPSELSSSGYPSRSMLSLFFDVGLMHTRDWIPLWPDMLE